MSDSTFSRQLLLASITVLISIAAPHAMATRAGTVEFVVGNAIAQGADGATRNLLRHAEINSGDRILTRDGRTQIRFTDGAFVSLVPDTEFVVRNYVYTGRSDGAETGFFSLLRGSIRAVSGAIGKVNHARFQINTPTATLGIRGTAGIIDVAADGTTRITSTSGIWVMSNATGTIEVPAGGSAIVTPNTTDSPRRTAAQATGARVVARSESASRGSPGESGRGDGNRQQQGPGAQRPIASNDPRGVPQPGTVNDPANGMTQPGATPPPPLPPSQPLGTGTTAPPVTAPPPAPTYISLTGIHSPTEMDYAVVPQTTPTFGVVGNEVVSIVLPSGGTIPNHALTDVRTLVTEVGSLGTDIYWGRWTGTYSAMLGGSYRPATASPNDGYHYLVGLPASPASMPTGTLSLNFIGATSPTISNGSIQPGQFSGSAPMIIDFNTGKIAVDFSLDWTAAQAAGAPMSISVRSPANLNSSTLQIDRAGTGSFLPTFKGSISAASGGSITITSAPSIANMQCATNCVASISGVIVGNGVTGAGFVYRVGDPANVTTITGAAAYRK
ncbi:MAG: FecR domain-containing protein [Burkholderiales bacterium]